MRARETRRMAGEDTRAIVLVALTVCVILAMHVAKSRRRRSRRQFSIGAKLKRTGLRWYWALKAFVRLQRERLTGAIPGITIAALRAVDGDTLDDPATGTRYRLTNIDCPETDERAGCPHERSKGEQAKTEARKILASAKHLEFRSTGRKDVYGRTVAHIRVDGRDFGKLMIKRGLARRWTGKRAPWCGARGGLVDLARASGTLHVCMTCHVGMALGKAAASTVVAYPAVFRKIDSPTDEQKP